jgi:hypothetical protein
VKSCPGQWAKRRRSCEVATETSVYFHETAWLYILESCHLHFITLFIITFSFKFPLLIFCKFLGYIWTQFLCFSLIFHYIAHFILFLVSSVCQYLAAICLVLLLSSTQITKLNSYYFHYCCFSCRFCSLDLRRNDSKSWRLTQQTNRHSAPAEQHLPLQWLMNCVEGKGSVYCSAVYLFSDRVA